MIIYSLSESIFIIRLIVHNANKILLNIYSIFSIFFVAIHGFGVSSFSSFSYVAFRRLSKTGLSGVINHTNIAHI